MFQVFRRSRRLRRFQSTWGRRATSLGSRLSSPSRSLPVSWAQANSAGYGSLPAFRIDSGRVPLICPRGRDLKTLASRAGWRRPRIPACHLLRTPAPVSRTTTTHGPARQLPACRVVRLQRDFATRAVKAHAHIGGSQRSIATGCKNGMETITRKIPRMVPDLPDGTPAPLSIRQL